MISLKDIIKAIVEMQIEGVEQDEIYSLKLCKFQLDKLYGMFVEDSDNDVSIQELKQTPKAISDSVSQLADEIVAQHQGEENE